MNLKVQHLKQGVQALLAKHIGFSFVGRMIHLYGWNYHRKMHFLMDSITNSPFLFILKPFAYARTGAFMLLWKTQPTVVKRKYFYLALSKRFVLKLHAASKPLITLTGGWKTAGLERSAFTRPQELWLEQRETQLNPLLWLMVRRNPVQASFLINMHLGSFLQSCITERILLNTLEIHWKLGCDTAISGWASSH